jgi:hypothetical protein
MHNISFELAEIQKLQSSHMASTVFSSNTFVLSKPRRTYSYHVI